MPGPRNLSLVCYYSLPALRWEFKIENETVEAKDGSKTVVEEGVKDEKKIRSEIRDVIRQITASVTFLPLLDCLCSFDILIYTHRWEGGWGGLFEERFKLFKRSKSVILKQSSYNVTNRRLSD